MKWVNYEINKDTLAILPINNDKSFIIEKNNEYIVDSKPYEVMEHSCEYFGSSLDGRLRGSKNMLGTIYKAPILVEETRNIIFFPTVSPLLVNNVWISSNNIEKYEKLGEKTKIYFKDGKDIIVDIPYLSFENQILRSSRLESIIRNRKNHQKND